MRPAREHNDVEAACHRLEWRPAEGRLECERNRHLALVVDAGYAAVAISTGAALFCLTSATASAPE
ncbi:MAG: hypothetical protein M3321_12505 [Actinomycetota bacterium]|nr:hypothetical protein [Actinomycetota bacterium]